LIATSGATASQHRPRTSRRGNRSLMILFATVIALLAIALLLLYLVPTATVTISLQARTFSQNIKLNATTNPAAPLSNKVIALLVQHDFSVSGSATASGMIKVGHATAQGKVTLANNGSANVIVPTGTIVATTSGVQFATDAEVVVAAQSSYPAVPVTALQAGDIGNVGANAITVIPQTSLTSIAQYNHTDAASLNLTVKNLKATSGGGAANVPAVTAQDRLALLHTLHAQLQKNVSSWLAAQVHTGDMSGKLIPDVLHSVNPLPEEQLSNTPGVGQQASGGTFPGTLSLHTSVLIARASALQEAASVQLNAAAARAQPASMLAAHQPVTLSNSKGISSQDGTSLAISAKASGEITRQLSPQNLSNALTGKGVGQVISDLKQAGMQDVQISVVPSFLSIMPLQAGRIQIILQPVIQTPPGNGPNG
jgi:hypothetical protein